MEGEDMIRVGLVGCGAAGMSHLKAMRATRGMRVAAVCDLNERFATRAAAEAGCAHYLDAETMMRTAKLDAVAIIATASAHYRLAALAARHDLHVLIEKPLTVDPSEGARLVRLFEKRTLILAVTFTYRYVDITRRMKRLIDEGEIGDVLELRHVGWVGLPRRYEAGTDQRVKYDELYSKEIRGILFDCGVHTMDLFRWLSGQEYVRFVGMGARHKGYEYPDSGTVLCEMTGGVRCVYDHGPLPYYLGGVDGIGLCMMVAAGTAGSLVWKIIDKRENGRFLSEFQVNTAKGTRVKSVPLFSKCRDKQHAEFVRCVRAGRLVGSFPDPHDANEATRAAREAVDAVIRHQVGGRVRGAARRGRSGSRARRARRAV